MAVIDQFWRPAGHVEGSLVLTCPYGHRFAVPKHWIITTFLAAGWPHPKNITVPQQYRVWP